MHHSLCLSVCLFVCFVCLFCLFVCLLGAVTEVLQKVEEDKPKNNFNDAKCDSCGRLWFGTMGNTTGPLDIDFGGGFYGFSKGRRLAVMTIQASAKLIEF